MKVTATIQSTIANSDPVEMTWLKDGDALSAVQSVVQLIQAQHDQYSTITRIVVDL